MKKHFLENLQIRAVSVIIDNVSTISCWSVLIIYLNCSIQDFEDSMIAFVDFMELEGKASEMYYITAILKKTVLVR